jgi:hypothetical protein
MEAVQALAPAPTNGLAERRKFGKNLKQLQLQPDERSEEADAKAAEEESKLDSGSLTDSSPISVQDDANSATSSRTGSIPVTQMICFWHDEVGTPISTRKFAPLSSSVSRFDMLHS